MITKIKLFRFLGIYSMIVLFLPIVIENVPSPLSIITGSTVLLGVFWAFLIFVYQPNVLLSKYMTIIYILGTILLIGSLTFWDNLVYSSSINIKWIILDLFGVFLATIMYLYFIYSKDYKGLAIVSVAALVFIIATSLISIIGLKMFPYAVRELSSGTAGKNDSLYMSLGIAGYTHWIGIIYIFPILIYFLKNKEHFRIKRWIILISIGVLAYSLVKTQITTALIISLFFIVYALINRRDLNSSGVLIVSFVFLSLFMLNHYIASFFYYLSSIMDSELLQSRIRDVGMVFEMQDFNPESGETYFATSRLSRMSISIESFLKNPIIGGPISGGHSTWLDKLGLFGLLGFIPWVVIFWRHTMLNLKLISKSYKPYYLLSVISCLLAGILTTTANSVHSCVVLFFVVPGLYFTGFLKKNGGGISSK